MFYDEPYTLNTVSATSGKKLVPSKVIRGIFILEHPFSGHRASMSQEPRAKANCLTSQLFSWSVSSGFFEADLTRGSRSLRIT